MGPMTHDALHDLTLIELVTIDGNLAVVNSLFDVTTQIPNIPVWSCQGILDYVNYPHAKEQRELNAELKFLKAKENGAEAVKTKNFVTDIYCYTEAITIKPTDATVLFSRSLC
ncbi:Sperm-associated antigen 1A [Bienertia sinuspersici]